MENERFSKTALPKRRTEITMQGNDNAPSQEKFAVMKETSMVGEEVQNLRRLFVQQPCSRFICRLIVCEFKYGSKLFTLHWIPIDYRLLSRYSVNNLLVHVFSEASLFFIEKKSRWVSIIDEHSSRCILNTLSIILSLTGTITPL